MYARSAHPASIRLRDAHDTSYRTSARRTSKRIVHCEPWGCPLSEESLRDAHNAINSSRREAHCNRSEHKHKRPLWAMGMPTREETFARSAQHQASAVSPGDAHSPSNHPRDAHSTNQRSKREAHTPASRREAHCGTITRRGAHPITRARSALQ